MASAKPSRWRGLIIPFFLAGCLLIGYYFYWQKVAGEIEARVNAAIPKGLATATKVSGFPYRLTLTLEGLNTDIGSGAGYSFKARQLRASATPFNPMLWVLEGADEVALVGPDGRAMPLVSETIAASLRLKPEGLERLSVTFQSLDSLETLGGPKVMSFGPGAMHLVSDPKNADTLAFSFEVKDMVLAKPMDGPGAILGETINSVVIRGPISKAQALTKSPTDWARAGGQINVMAGEILWGPVSLTNATGNLRLNERQKWQGDVQGTGALKPEGLSVAGLSGPVTLAIVDNKLALSGLPGIALPEVFGGRP